MAMHREDWATVAVTQDVRTAAAQLADVSAQLKTEADHWRHPAWGARLRLASEDVAMMAEGLVLIADEGDYWRMRGALDRALEERAAAEMMLRRATRQRESLFAPDRPERIGRVGA